MLNFLYVEGHLIDSLRISMFHDVSELSNQTLLQSLKIKKGHIKAKQIEANASKSPENYDDINTD